MGGRWRRDWGVAVAVLLTLLVAAYGVGFVLGWGGADARAKLTYALYLPLTFGPMVLAWRVAGRRSLPLATRRAWRRVGVGLAGWFLANVGWLWFEALRGVETPVVFDVVYLAGAGVMLVGLLAFPGRRRSRQEQVRLALDIGVVVAAAFVVVWYLVLGPATKVEDPEWMTVVLSVAYPVTDLVLVFGIVTAMLRGAPASSTGSLQLLLLGIGAYVIADVADGYMNLHGGEAVNLRWTHLLWLGGLLLFAVAADGQWAHATEEEAAEEPVRARRAFSALPYLAVAGGYGLLLIVARGLALWMSDKTPISLIQLDILQRIGSGKVLGVPVPALVFLAVTVAGWVLLNRTTFGRHTIAVGGNRSAARIAGIRSSRVVFAVYALTGLCVGISAILLSGRLASASPVVGNLVELDAIAAVVIGGTALTGGKATVTGTFFGVITFALIFNLLNLLNMPSEIQGIVKGVLILAAVALQRRD